jgi:uncharacterized protein (TIGR02231 family)
MKVSASFLRVALPAMLVSIHLQGSQIDSKIDRVHVYPNSAKIVRVFDAQLEPGANALKLLYLPDSIDPDRISVIVDPQMRTSVQIAEIALKTDKTLSERHPEIQELTETIATLRNELKSKQAELTLIMEKSKFAGSLKDAVAEGIGTGESERPAMDEIMEMWEFYRSTVVESEQLAVPVQDAINNLQDQLREKDREYLAMLKEIQKLTSVLELNVASTTPGSVGFELHYFTDASSWRPVYAMKAFPELSTIETEYMAAIRHFSGENWDNVRVNLSTAMASRNVRIPQLYPIRLNRHEEYYAVQNESVMGDAMVGSVQKQSVRHQPLPAPPAPTATFSASSTSFSVELPHRTSIVSGSDFSHRLIASESASAEFWTQMAPRNSGQSVLVGKLKNPFEFPLSSGDAQLYVDDEAVGSTYISEIAPGAELEMALGANETVFLDWIDGTDNERGSGLFEKVRKITRQYFSTVRNDGSIQQTIRLYEQLPVSENEKIKVRQISPDSSEVVFDEDKPGVFYWEFQLNPGESKRLTNEFEVTFPEDWTIPMNF